MRSGWRATPAEAWAPRSRPSCSRPTPSLRHSATAAHCATITPRASASSCACSARARAPSRAAHWTHTCSRRAASRRLATASATSTSSTNSSQETPRCDPSSLRPWARARPPPSPSSRRRVRCTPSRVWTTQLPSTKHGPPCAPWDSQTRTWHSCWSWWRRCCCSATSASSTPTPQATDRAVRRWAEGTREWLWGRLRLRWRATLPTLRAACARAA
mmetsp:Transcript_22816/g.57921  ORF Transcript_22816/g.57921 Transcript_22816/m.57921 type:complete len:216 (-) Transcript_22816:3480-4127(-)